MKILDAFEYDKFQIAGILTSEGIYGFFANTHHVSVLNNVYAANQIIYDISKKYFKLTGRNVPSLFHKTRSQWNDPVLEDYRLSANFIKHADKDWEQFRPINPADILGYINALTYDYRGLRDCLLNDGYIARHDEAKKEIAGLDECSRVDLLVEIFPQYMTNILFGQSAGSFDLKLIKLMPELRGNFSEHLKRKAVFDFIQKHDIHLRGSGGLPDYYMTQVARPNLDSLVDIKPPTHRAG